MGCGLQRQGPCDREWFTVMWPTPHGWVCLGGWSETGSEASSEPQGPPGSVPSSPTTSRSGGEVVTLPPVHLIRRGALPGYRFPPPYTTYDVTMPYDDHREMVGPTWVAHPGVDV